MNRLICFFLYLFATGYASHSALRINIYTNFNGQGLEVDQKILKQELQKLGHSVYTCYWTHNTPSYADINIFLERIIADRLPYAKLNWFISNPEWYIQDEQLLNDVDLILCRTQQSLKIFKPYNRTFYLGFTSPDTYRPDIEKDYQLMVHLPGGAVAQKGTDEVVSLWNRKPHLPHLILVDWEGKKKSLQNNLTLIPYRLKMDEYRILQNRAGFHLCPSIAEGFGHYIMEAMAAKCVVLTTQGTPMNELISDPRCLIPSPSSAPYRLGVQYTIDEEQIEKKVMQIIHLPEEELRAIGERNRKEYLRRTEEFQQRLKILLENTQSMLNS